MPLLLPEQDLDETIPRAEGSIHAEREDLVLESEREVTDEDVVIGDAP